MATKSSKKTQSAPKNADTPDMPNPAEWDFRTIPSHLLRVATEYEYARESELKNQITHWQQGDFWSINFDWVYRLKSLKHAGLVDYKKGSFFDKVANCEESEDLDQSKRIALYQKAYDRWNELERAPATIAEGVRKLIANEDDPVARYNRCILLADYLPTEITEKNLSHVAIFFDQFPEPFISVLGARSQEYFDRRLPISDSNPGIFDLADTPNPIDYSDIEAQLTAGIHTIAINWSAPLDILTKEFRTWILARRPAKPGNRPLEPYLKWLATHRLAAAGLTYKEAQKMISAHKDNTPDTKVEHGSILPIFTQQADWQGAARKARDLLAGDFVSAIRTATFRF